MAMSKAVRFSRRLATALGSLVVVASDWADAPIIDPSPKKQYNGGGDAIWIRLNRTPSLEEVDSTFSHEIGHVLMTQTGANNEWQEVVEADYLSVSGYGNRNLWEDFAEFTLLYLRVEDEPEGMESIRTLYPHRFAAFTKAWKKSKELLAARGSATQPSP